jgi:two-component system, cell cycle response regulator
VTPRLTSPTARKPIKILLIEHRTNDAHLLRVLLSAETHYSLTIAPQLARGISYLVKERFDLVLLDLSLPDCPGVEAVCHVRHAAHTAPIVVLHDQHDEQLATRALQEGAQDYLVKEEIDRALLFRVVRYACERHRLMACLQSLALTDTLTGLYNRHGFVTIAQEQLKLAQRNRNSMVLAFVDLDGMKRINDELGHEFGDQALVATARVLKSTFRASDLIARLGGDEFIVLGLGVQANATGRIHKRLMHNLAVHNKSQSVMTVAFSVGFASYKPSRRDQKTIEQLMTQADQAMYVEKQSHHVSRTFQEAKRANNCRLPRQTNSSQPKPLLESRGRD